MNNELNHSKNPIKLSFFWIVVYAIIAMSILVVVSMVANQYRTHTLPTGDITLTIPYSKYAVGETINFTIKNNFNSSIYLINNCPSEPLGVYKLINGEWIRQHDQASRYDCPNEQRQVTVGPGGTVDGDFAPWTNLFSQPGKYRIVAFVEYYNSLPYQDLEVVKMSDSASNSQTQANTASTPITTSTQNTSTINNISSANTSVRSEDTIKSNKEGNDN